MKSNCIVCKKVLEKEICQACSEFLELKYPNKKELEQVLQWHKNHTKKLNEED
ncbi:hypothetical protein K8R30_04800 [archaeon]|nr:hypothetical protein [archaeon]